MAMLFPAVQKVRDAARSAACANNLKQISLATHNYEAQTGYFPPGWKSVAPDASGNVGGWSTHGLLLPFLDQGNLYSKVDFSLSYKDAAPVRTADGAITRISAMKIPTYVCPAEIRDEPRMDKNTPPSPEHYPVNYAMNMGVWFVYDPATRRGGEGAFYPNSRLLASSFSDGMSFTMCAAEVKGWNSYYRNAARPGESLSGVGKMLQINTTIGRMK